jgi:hypothetical protein
MSNELIFVLLFFWVVSAAYTMYYHNKNWTLGLDMIIGAILLGPILALIVGDDVKRIEKHYKQKEKESNVTHRRWFQLSDRINRERMRPTWFRTIPPPPPLSRVERARSERDEAIRTARERIEPPNRRPNNKDFKFFRG